MKIILFQRDNLNLDILCFQSGKSVVRGLLYIFNLWKDNSYFIFQILWGLFCFQQVLKEYKVISLFFEAIYIFKNLKKDTKWRIIFLPLLNKQFMKEFNETKE